MRTALLGSAIWPSAANTSSAQRATRVRDRQDSRARYAPSRVFIRIAALLGSALAGATSLPAHAQGSGEAAATLEEIVVTAERRTSTAQKTAASVAVRSGEELLSQGRYSLESILEDVPGVSGGAASANSGTRDASSGTDSPASGLTFRGIPSNTGVAGSHISNATSAALYVDGVYSGTGGSYDIDRVEVLRGPQGTLYGRSATSGVVAIHTRSPDLHDVDLGATVEAGNYSLRHVTGAFNVPLVEGKLALRLSGNYYDREGFIHPEGGALTNKDMRAKLLYEPNEVMSLLLGYAQQDVKQGSGGANLTLVTPNDYVVNDVPVGPGENKTRQYWAELNWSLGDLTLTYQPSYRTWESDAFTALRVAALRLGIDTFITTPTDYFHTQELRLASADDLRLKWQVGALYYYNKLENHSVTRNDISGALNSRSDTRKSTKALGGFGELTYSIADDWRVTAGLRYDSTKVNVNQDYTTNTNTSGVPGTPTFHLPEMNVLLSLSGQEGIKDYHNTTYKLRLEHDLSSQSLAYAMISTGFTPGDVSAATGVAGPVVIAYDAETLTAYELGTKNQFLDNRLRVNASAYYYDYGAFQATQNISPIPLVLAFAPVAAPARVYGAELELLLQATPRDQIGFNLGYTHAKFRNADQQVIPGTGGKTFADFIANSSIPRTVPVSAQLSYDHGFYLPGGSALTVRGVLRYKGAYDSAPMSATLKAQGAGPYVRVDSSVLGDLNAGWTSSNKRFSVTAYVRNVSDETSPDYVGLTSSPTGAFAAQASGITEPRTYGVVLSARM